MNKLSFTSAGFLPIKLFKAKEAGAPISPLHIQLGLTSKCNLHCKFCSQSARDMKAELPFSDLVSLVSQCKALGTQAVTITGGGEPLLYPAIRDAIDLFYNAGIKIGLVTNGYLLDRIEGMIDQIKWLRISMSSDRDIPKLKPVLDKITKEKTDWAFSYVVMRDIDMPSVKWCLEYGNKHHFTHVRFVPDLLDNYAEGMEKFKKAVKASGVNDKLAIYQDRSNFTHGTGVCPISLLKPMINPDGYIYPCCGVQYADKIPQRGFPSHMRMGKIKDFTKIIKSQKAFDGGKCFRCYYSLYNEALNLLSVPLEHKEFI